MLTISLFILIHLKNLLDFPMSREVHITSIKTFAAVEQLSDVDENQVDVVIASPDTSVVSDKKGLDDNDLTENELLLPDAAELIEVVHQATSEKNVNPPQSSSQQTSRKSKSNSTRLNTNKVTEVVPEHKESGRFKSNSNKKAE